MAESVVLTVALEIVCDLLVGEAYFLNGVRGEVEEIERELKGMKFFLEYADAKRHEDKMLGKRVADIRELAEEVADVLETYAIEVASRRSSQGIRNNLKRYACIFNECIALHKLGSEIVSINTKLTNLTNRFPIYAITKGESSDSTHEKQQYWQQSFPQPEKDFVGMEEDIIKLVSLLVNDDEDKLPQYCRRVVSICGMGGIGKTSLARKVYYHNEVQRCFERFAWVCVTQRCHERKILQEILSGLIPKCEKILNMTDQQLVKQLYEVQEKKKCLIVIDDIWSTDAWDSLERAFPNSKILLTSRNKEVALHADPSGFLHELQCLGEEEGWDLLKKKAFPGRDIGTGYTINQRMEELGREMVRRCGGLPLAIVVLGGILIMKQSSQEWEVVLRNIKRFMARGEGTGKEQRGVSTVLELSYNNLPFHLKSCFLYLANFPEGSVIKAKRLCHLWVAERIVSSDDRNEDETMIDVAEKYLGELAQRCMVHVRVNETQITKIRFKSCRLHDLMRDLCLSKVKEENFLKVIGSGDGNDECSTRSSSNITRTRRLSIHNNDEVGECEMPLKKTKARHVRSLLIFEEGAGFWFKIKDNINYFKLLRVLDIEGVDMPGQELPKAIGKIMKLRYMSLKYGMIETLPSSLGKLAYLETLDLRTHTRLFIPNVLWKLQRLRHLYLPRVIHFDREKEKKLRLDGLNNLETLVSFNSMDFYVNDLLKLTNIRKLKAYVIREHESLAHMATAITSTNSLLRQSYLSISGYSFHSEEELNLLRRLLECHHLNRLYLAGPISKLPENYIFSPNLTRLFLCDSKLEDDPMPTLGKLPFLIFLSIGRDVFMGKEMVCSSTDFVQLRILDILGLCNLENWTVDQGAFPNLSRCTIYMCPNFKMIPDGFIFLKTLQQLSIRDMTREFLDRLKVVDGIEGEDYHKIQFIPSLIIF